MSKSLRQAVSAVAILAALTAGVPASAQSQPDIVTSIVRVPASPISIETCRLRKGTTYSNQWQGTVVVGNHTKHALVSATLHFVVYDQENTKLAQVDVKPTITGTLASTDTGPYEVDVLPPLAGADPKIVTRVSCRVQGAVFTANKRWTLGQKWAEKLLPLNTESENSNEGEGRGAAAVSSAVPHLQIGVSNAWNDTANGVTFVHDTLTIFGGDAPATLQPGNFTLQMALTNGAKKSYSALLQAAPTYQKLNPLTSQMSTAYEVDPATDLGRLGAVIVPAHGSATITVTFAVQDPVANASDNRAVTLR